MVETHKVNRLPRKLEDAEIIEKTYIDFNLPEVLLRKKIFNPLSHS